jgi:hypothetical protein
MITPISVYTTRGSPCLLIVISKKIAAMASSISALPWVGFADATRTAYISPAPAAPTPVNAHKAIEFALHRLNFRDIDMKEADGIALELLALWLVSFDIRQARDAVPLKVRRVRK